MDVWPTEMQTAIERTIRIKAKAYESGGMLTIPNPAILISASK
jgi:hypothetical protein